MIEMTTWPERVTGQRAMSGGVQRDHATCTWEGREFKVLRFSATTALARELVAAGCSDQPWQAVTPTGRRSFHGPSLHRWATRVVAEDDRGLGVKEYVPFPSKGFRLGSE